jgi:hypothetical protein
MPRGRRNFDQTRRTVLTLLPTIDGIDAEGFASDLHDALARTTALRGVRVRKTPDASMRFEAVCGFIGEARALAAALQRVWTRELAFGRRLESHRIATRHGEVVMEFITWREGAHHAAGRVMARRLPRRSHRPAESGV